ncbi:MAG: nickel pincer cofactor biosynthesis protein LarC [Deltaproteobacteria bacterium]|nr:nickel pincer cofactor biosynthesis protein LarC [Deltaproteobacteria bacterium]
MRTILYYDCYAGISGDMHVGALLDVGVDPEHLLRELKKLDLQGYDIKIGRKKKNGITGTRFEVCLSGASYDSHGKADPGHRPVDSSDCREIDADSERDTHGHSHRHVRDARRHDRISDHEHRNFGSIRALINASSLNESVKSLSIKIFFLLASAESKVHNKPSEEIHFHEVGAVDSIVDIVGSAICIDYLKPDRIICSSVELGGGFVDCAHGRIPVPAPAVTEILTGVPVKTGVVPYETTTPTGAAIIKTLCSEYSDRVHFEIKKTGWGLGARDLEMPNCLRVYLGKEEDEQRSAGDGDVSYVLSANIDDMNPEIYEYLMDKLLANGADDVYLVPLIMKKSRPAVCLNVLCSGRLKENMKEFILLNTTSLGIREHMVGKSSLRREITVMNTEMGEVRVKHALHEGRIVRSKPEYEDCKRIADERGLSIQSVYDSIQRHIRHAKDGRD